MDKHDDSFHHQPVEPKRQAVGLPAIIGRYRLVLLAVLVGAVMIGGSMVYVATIGDRPKDDFNPESVLTQSGEGTGPAGNESFTTDSIKQYDGKDGNACYVAVDGVVYEIPQTGQWQSGQHSPSNGQAYCGADMSEALKKSPHGASKIRELRKVGTFSS